MMMRFYQKKTGLRCIFIITSVDWKISQWRCSRWNSTTKKLGDRSEITVEHNLFSILAFLTGSKIYLKEICGRGQFGIFGQSFLQRRSQDWKTTNGVGGNSLLRTIDWGQIRSKWTNLAAGWFLSPANQSQSSSLKKSRWKKTLPAKTHL